MTTNTLAIELWTTVSHKKYNDSDDQNKQEREREERENNTKVFYVGTWLKKGQKKTENKQEGDREETRAHDPVNRLKMKETSGTSAY